MTAAPLHRLLMPKGDAARYLGTSPQRLDEWGVAARVRPDGRKVYDRRDLDAWADNLPYDGEGESTCAADEAFG